MSHADLILLHLKSGKTITAISALAMFGCFRCGARIYDLKAKGHNIETIMISKGQESYASYKLIR